MRDIKFRIWDVAEGKMCRSTTIKEYMEADAVKIPEGEEKYIMQYTGLKDKNGKEIYEGDVVCYVTDEVVEVISGYPRTEPEGHFGAVEFSNGAFWVNGKGEFYFYGEQNFLWSELEVIGNIYENPDLLL